MPQLTCNRCGETWTPRPPSGKDPVTWRPKACPNCNSRKWDKK